jgi:hypothetical protein
MQAHKVRTRGTALIGPTESLTAPLARYLFGPAPAASYRTEVMMAEIRRLGGLVAPPDVMRVTGLDRAQAEAALCRLAARENGDVAVVDGAVLYHFPQLGRASRARPAPIWDFPTPVDAITGNEESVDLVLLFVNLLLLAVFGTVVARTIVAGSIWPPALALAGFALALTALSMPILRVALRRTHLREVAAEDGRRALMRAVLERTPGAPVSAHALSHVWAEAAGHAIAPHRLTAELRALGGEPDVDDQARLQYRFPDLDYEARALALVRTRA